MSLILTIETATSACSVALAKDGELQVLKESAAPNAHSSQLTVFVEQLFRETRFRLNDLDAVAVSMGPGSYTGLRIGVSAAKGLCYALEKPLLAVPTLQAMALGMRDTGNGRRRSAGCRLPPLNRQLLFCPVIDARRMEVFCAIYDEQMIVIRPAEALVLCENSFDDLLSTHVLVFGGSGAQKIKLLLAGNPNRVFLDDFKNSAIHMIPLADQRFVAGHFENLAYFEPYYLKDFVAGSPRVKGLR